MSKGNEMRKKKILGKKQQKQKQYRFVDIIIHNGYRHVSY